MISYALTFPTSVAASSSSVVGYMLITRERSNTSCNSELLQDTRVSLPFDSGKIK